MNYKNNALRELNTFAKEFPHYSVGQLLYSVIRLTEAEKISDLLEISDEDFFTAIEKTIKLEDEN